MGMRQESQGLCVRLGGIDDQGDRGEGPVGVGAEAAGDGAAAGEAQQADGRVAQHRHDGWAGRQVDEAVVLAAGDILDVVQAVLNCLIANDKICFVRIARLMRDQARRSSPRGRRRPPNPGYPSDDGDRRGGSDETRLAYPTGVVGDTGRATALGSRLPGTADLGVRGRCGPGAGGEQARKRGAG